MGYELPPERGTTSQAILGEGNVQNKDAGADSRPPLQLRQVGHGLAL